MKTIYSTNSELIEVLESHGIKFTVIDDTTFCISDDDAERIEVIVDEFAPAAAGDYAIDDMKRFWCNNWKLERVFSDNGISIIETEDGRFISVFDAEIIEGIAIANFGPSAEHFYGYEGQLLVESKADRCYIYPKNFSCYNYEMENWTTAEMEAKLDIDRIIELFAENGYNVSKAAIMHNYKAWLSNYKAGYRGRGYHIFTASRENSLYFCASKLSEDKKAFQSTYIA